MNDMNKDFQELKAKYLRAIGGEKESFLVQMRENLKNRNGNESLYTNHYTHQGETIDIDTCDEQKLFEIDNDMIVIGK